VAETVISIFGTGRARQGEPAFELALETGRALAQTGFVIANGGYGGTMLACAKGARDAGGEVIGVTCSAFGKAKANEYISREIVTHSLDERLQRLVDLGKSYVVLPGGTGTLLELAKVWELKNKGFLAEDKSIIIVGDFWRPLLDVIAGDDPGSGGFIETVKNPEEAAELLKVRLGDGDD
jgi:uncharacterized protein (TIGR00725 family)